MTEAGITAIDFGAEPPQIVRADGTRHAMSAQVLTSDLVGRIFAAVEGGVLESVEDGARTLHAVNTRAFDGQAAHTHGGGADLDGDGVGRSGDGRVAVGAGDKRLASTSARTQAGQHRRTEMLVAQRDARLSDAAAGQVMAGQDREPLHAAAATSVRGNGIVFVAADARGPGQQQRDVTAAWIRSADNPFFGLGSVATPLMALAAGAGATQHRSAAAAWAPEEVVVARDLPTPVVPRQASPAAQTPNAPAIVSAGASILREREQRAALDSETVRTVMSAAPSPAADAQAAGLDVPVAPETPKGLVPAERLARLSDAAQYGPGSTPAAPMVVDLPHLQGEHAEGIEDIGLRFTESLLLANDSTLHTPPSGQPALRIVAVSAPEHGTVSLQRRADGGVDVLFVPEANYHGPARFSYTVSDAYGLTQTATLTMSVGAVNDAPHTLDETASGDEDRTLVFTAASLIANDLDVDSAVDGDILRITRVGTAEHGTVALRPDGTVRFVPDPDYNGPARFSYWVGDRDAADIAAGEGWETQGTLNLAVLPVNDLPVVACEMLDSEEDVMLRIPPALLLANDRDADGATNGQVLSIAAVGGAQHGRVGLMPDGTIQFTPERDYFGPAAFTYTVDDGHGGQVQGTVVLDLAPRNDAPLVVGEDIRFSEDEIQTIGSALLLANDSDVDTPWSRLRIVAADNATHGTVRLDPSGAIRFVPEHDYFGGASFTYTVSDGAGAFTVGVANLDIAPVNDAPRVVGEVLAADEDTRLRIGIAALLANDVDVDGTHGDLSIVGVGNPTHGSVQRIGGEIVFMPDADFHGQAGFTYTVADGAGGLSEAAVKLVFRSVNDAPVANDELLWGKQGIVYTLTQAALLANDSDVEDATALRIVDVRNARHGTVVLNSDGSVGFSPEARYAGRGTFEYVVEDSHGAQSTATARIDFSRVNVNPLATDDSFIGYEDVALSIAAAQLLLNDSDADNSAQELRITAVDDALHGTVGLAATGDVSFLPDANFHGMASFRYRVSDSDGGQTWATAHLNVQPVNDAPVIEDVWHGRPIYGYRWEATKPTDGRHNTPFYEWTLSAVTSEAQAQALLADPNDVIVAPGPLLHGEGPVRPNTLLDASGSPLMPSNYLNGDMRPVAFHREDAVFTDRYGSRSLDDPYRQNGAIVAYDPDGNSDAIRFDMAATPQHGHAWINHYAALGASTRLDHTQIGAHLIAENGAWQYFSHRGDPYTGADPFWLTATDAEGASASVRVDPVHAGSSAGGGQTGLPTTNARMNMKAFSTPLEPMPEPADEPRIQDESTARVMKMALLFNHAMNNAASTDGAGDVPFVPMDEASPLQAAAAQEQAMAQAAQLT